jgi:hypothetical protein
MNVDTYLGVVFYPNLGIDRTYIARYTAHDIEHRLPQ